MNWLEGKKTYLAAAVLVIAASFGFWSGALSDQMVLLVLAGALGMVGLGHKADRLAVMIVELLGLLRTAIEEQRKTGKADLKPIVTAVAKDAADLASAASAASEHFALFERADRETRLAIALAEELQKYDGGKFHSSLTWNGKEWTH